MTTESVTILAKSDIDWLQFIVFALVIGSSALGAIGKKLIAYFGGDKAATKDSPTARSRDHRRVAKPRPMQPSRPIAKPFHASSTMPPSPRPVAKSRRTTAVPKHPHEAPPHKAPPVASTQGTDLPELLAEIIGFPKPKTKQPQPKQPLQSQKIRQAAPPKRPIAPPPPKRPNLAPRGELRTTSARSKAAKLSAQKFHGLQSKRSSLRKPVSKHNAADGQHLIHLEDVADLADTLHSSQQAYERFVTGHALRPTPMALRKAVILNEILQPPVSLRADPF